MRAEAQAQPNIALIKYWGKRDRDRNLPASGSLSVTLDSLWTRMAVDFGSGCAKDCLLVNGEVNPAMLARVSACLDRLCGVKRPAARIDSTGNFPIGAGLASSASAFAALVTAAARAANITLDRLTLARQAGATSGSAARSLYPGIVELCAGDDEIQVASIAAASEWPLRIVVAITEESSKPLASGDAMIRSAATSPFYASWIDRQNADLQLARAAVQQRDFAALAAVAEHNCLKMHSVMWTSRPAIVYWNNATIACMESIRVLQRAGHAVFFTIDAGPQLKAICLREAEASVISALSATSGVRRVMTSGLGEGARLLDAA
ncbi:MAG: diphosphomevalonate decarboxylase [Woeseia sp.]